MKILLIKDVPKLGRRGDTVTVRDGYARNFLLSRSLAFPAGDARSKKMLAAIKSQQKAKKQLQERGSLLTARLQSHVFVFQRAATEQGTLYAAVVPAEIAQAVSDYLGIPIDAPHITVPTPIKRIGSHGAICRIGGKNAECKLLVTPLTT